MSINIIDWNSHEDDDGILWLVLDQQNTDTNVLSISVLQQLDALLDQVTESPPRAIIFRSGKSSGFIAGADVNDERVTETVHAVGHGKRFGDDRDCVEGTLDGFQEHLFVDDGGARRCPDDAIDRDAFGRLHQLDRVCDQQFRRFFVPLKVASGDSGIVAGDKLQGTLREGADDVWQADSGSTAGAGQARGHAG